MAYTLFDLLIDVYDELGKLNVGQATGGSATTIVDTYLDKEVENDTWKGGSYFIISTTDALSPQGLMGLISDSNASGQSFTFATIAAAVEAGDRYGYTSQEYPLYQVIQACNRGLRSLGSVATVDTSLTVVADQTEYAIPVALKRRPPLQVLIPTETDADNQKYEDVRGWDILPAGPNATGTLILPNDDLVGKTISLVYLAAHTALRDSTDVVSEYIEPELAKWAGVHAALKWQNGRTGSTNKGVIEDLNDAKEELAAATRIYRVWKPKRKPRLKKVWSA